MKYTRFQNRILWGVGNCKMVRF